MQKQAAEKTVGIAARAQPCSNRQTIWPGVFLWLNFNLFYLGVYWTPQTCCGSCRSYSEMGAATNQGWSRTNKFNPRGEGPMCYVVYKSRGGVFHWDFKTPRRGLRTACEQALRLGVWIFVWERGWGEFISLPSPFPPQQKPKPRARELARRLDWEEGGKNKAQRSFFPTSRFLDTWWSVVYRFWNWSLNT